ncbi:MAG: DUF2851 family protein [Bacteroidetes bacterium]|nr:DUF2851 family protein [Bacteroidota bacterium]
MTEKLLQFIWQKQYFNNQQLKTVDGNAIQIVKPGNLNLNQGPDFLNASIKINNIVLVGNIEVHINASDWLLHHHSSDENYNNIILHIVWQNDTQIFDKNNILIATIELQSIVPKVLLEKYNALMLAKNLLPCASFLPALSIIGWLSWKERLATERLLLKSENVLNIFKTTNNNWEETFWQMLAYNFGLKLNADLFKQVAQSISVNILGKHKNQIHQLEAMLFGQANLLQSNMSNSYGQMLYKEYLFLQKKYSLQKTTIQPMFLRMRPANFPTIRLAQLAMLIHQSSHLFSKIKEQKNVAELRKLFAVVANDFWNTHYTIEEEAANNEPKYLGKQMINGIIINTELSLTLLFL